MARNHTPKPLQGSKRYSLLPLECHTKKCDHDFFVSKSGRRKCYECWSAPAPAKKETKTETLLRACGLI